jgi:hypothetical protein
VAGATVLALGITACENVNFPSGGTLATDDLLILPLSPSAPQPAGASFYVYNAHATTGTLLHNDGFNTLFAQLDFPRGSLARLNGVSLGADDSVLVTVTADAGVYGIRLAPDGLEFTPSGGPTLTLSYVRYGDLTVAAGSRYADAAAYASALGTWFETSTDTWSQAGTGGAAGSNVSATLAQPGHYIAAAPR